LDENRFKTRGPIDKTSYDELGKSLIYEILMPNSCKTYDSNLAVISQSYVVFVDELQVLSA